MNALLGSWLRAGRASPVTLRVTAIGLLVVVAVAFPAFEGGDSFVMYTATQALVYGLAVVTLNLLVGFGGQISLGHAGFLAVGGYTAAVLATHVGGLPAPIEVLAAGAVTAAVGLLLGLPTGRLRGHYLAILTLGFGLAVPQIALNWTSLTLGRTGLVVPPPRVGGTVFVSPSDVYYFTLIVFALCLVAIFTILASSSGRAFAAVRDSEAAATAMGINVNATKVVLFTTSAFFAGVAGDLSAHLQGLVSPDSFPFSLSLFFFAAVVVGGLASVWGSLAAAVVLAVIEAKTSSSSGYEPVIIGGAVVILLLITPGGLADLSRRVRAALGAWSRRHPGGGSPSGETGRP
ncbi:MAG: branched-chain amino acid ABC transporter permease [Solirubrobacteraceae bacterium]